MTLADLGCNPLGDPSLTHDHLHDGTVIDVGSHHACLVTNVQGTLILDWVDPDGVTVDLRGDAPRRAPPCR